MYVGVNFVLILFGFWNVSNVEETMKVKKGQRIFVWSNMWGCKWLIGW